MASRPGPLAGDWPPRRIAGAALLALGALFLAWEILVAGLSSAALRDGDADGAMAFDGTMPGAVTLAASEAFSRGDKARSIALAQQALAAAPINQRALTLVALNQQRTRDLLPLSAGLGWRDRMTQMVLAQAAVANGSAPLFAQRFDAFARQSYNLMPFIPLLDSLIGNDGVRAALIPRLALQPNWRATYLSSMPDTDAGIIPQRARLLDDLVRAGAPPTRDELDGYTSRLYRLEYEGEAYRVWKTFVARPPLWSGLVYDGGFHAMLDGGAHFPFEWNFGQTAGAYAALETQATGLTLHAHNEGQAQGRLVLQKLRLAPGRYQLTVRASGQDNDASAVGGKRAGFGWSLSCDGEDDPLDGLAPNAQARLGTATYGLLIPRNCPNMTLSLMAVPDTGGAHDMWVSSARIDPAG